MLGAGVSATGASRLVLIPVKATILPRGALAAIREGIMLRERLHEELFEQPLGLLESRVS